MNHAEAVTDPHATLAIADQATGRSATDLLHNFVVICPTCKHPYAASFQGYEYILTGQPVCAGSLAMQFCKPVIYHVFPLPLTALSMDIVINEKRYRGATHGDLRIFW